MKIHELVGWWRKCRIGPLIDRVWGWSEGKSFCSNISGVSLASTKPACQIYSSNLNAFWLRIVSVDVINMKNFTTIISFLNILSVIYNGFIFPVQYQVNFHAALCNDFHLKIHSWTYILYSYLELNSFPQSSGWSIFQLEKWDLKVECFKLAFFLWSMFLLWIMLSCVSCVIYRGCIIGRKEHANAFCVDWTLFFVC